MTVSSILVSVLPVKGELDQEMGMGHSSIGSTYLLSSLIVSPLFPYVISMIECPSLALR